MDTLTSPRRTRRFKLIRLYASRKIAEDVMFITVGNNNDQARRGCEVGRGATLLRGDQEAPEEASQKSNIDRVVAISLSTGKLDDSLKFVRPVDGQQKATIFVRKARVACDEHLAN